jgi:hypothetical protein
MPGAAQTLGGIFGGGTGGKILSAVPAIFGTIGNLLAGRQQQQVSNDIKAQEAKIASLSPADLTRMVQSAEAPINQELEQSINNQVQGDMASRGLSQAPGIFAASEAQALGPIEQQNYQVALQQVLTQLGLPLEYAKALIANLPKGQDLSGAFQLLLKQMGGKTNPNPNPGTAPYPLPSQGGPATPPIFGDTTPTASPDVFNNVSSILNG